ncbi:MAG: OmpA family protein [Sedimentisphaerales bacterium]|nr:OmpA family protein [Sedimentisphaerales bacterium]
MQVVNTKSIVPLIVIVLLSLLSGCTDYKKKYDYLNVEHQNLRGRYENVQTEKQAMAERISQDQQTIDELRRQIEQLNQSPAKATGFGDEYDVKFDPSTGTITVTLPNTILFDSGKATLKSATSKELDHILAVLKDKWSGKQIDVVGHTDNDPIKKSPWKDNWELSTQRALSVARYLTDHGIPAKQVEASGCGSFRPVATNSTVEGKARNRRCEIVVYVRQSAPADAVH